MELNDLLKKHLLGRYLDYAKTGSGGHKRPSKRHPENFRFFILQRVPPDSPEHEIVVARTYLEEVPAHEGPHGLNAN